ncbi:GNAT family N-acetyltransferase [Cumulibacter manganitolerans]|uniref:GNAT family N-acetyltransferase n=1 Tax=Cumulibacter manganitolerans TaxID=1884992 RepID=UPI001295225F|nr:GNAT family N-acetyltransferase [Cumulibacter manganitolerans]
MTIRTCEPGDQEALEAFLRTIPEQERAFHKAEGADAALAAEWSSQRDPLRLVDVADDGVVRGMIGIRRGRGMSAHTGEITLLVDPAFRQQQIATNLVVAAIGEALKAGLSHVFVEVTAEHTATVGMFRKLGFEAEALLQGFIKRRDGELQDLIMMTNRLEENWAAAQLVGLETGDAMA